MADQPSDLRSDTATKPSPAMREVRARAEVGDDVLGVDPTAVKPQEKAAELRGKEAALFVPSGTRANQLCLKIHTQPGQEVICADTAHIVTTEVSMMAAFSGVQPRTIPAPQGYFTAVLGTRELIKEARRVRYYCLRWFKEGKLPVPAEKNSVPPWPLRPPEATQQILDKEGVL